MTRQAPTPHAIARSAPLRLTGLVALALVLTGCASLSPDGGFGDVEKATAERIGSPVQLAWARQPEDLDRIAQRVDELLGKPLSMDDAVQVALLNNRGLQAAYAELGITEAEVVQAGRLPNPGFSFGRLTKGDEIELERGLHLNLARLIAMPLVQRVEARRSSRCAARWRCRCCRWQPTRARPGCRPWLPRRRCATAAR
jgi:hypothetical protein